MKFIIVFLLLFCVTISVQAQELPNNKVHFSASVINSDYSLQGSWLSFGFNVGYSRYIHNRMYVDLSAGKGHFEGKNSSRYKLREDEKENLNLTTYGIGFGYDFIRTEKLSLAGQLNLSNFHYRAVTGLDTDGEGKITYRSVEPVNETDLIVGLRINNRLGEHTSLITNLGYDLAPRIERIIFNTGISFSF